ncbi:MAG TPA: hypothetical protein VJB06_03960 [archaeon]|nr:hypothetical protein [archaeon]
MNLRQLDNVLKDMMPQSEAHRTLDKISHWLDTMKIEKKYETSEEKDIKALKNLSSLGLVTIQEADGKIKAELTPDAQEVYKEMVARGFYLKKGKV